MHTYGPTHTPIQGSADASDCCSVAHASGEHGRAFARFIAPSAVAALTLVAQEVAQATDQLLEEVSKEKGVIERQNTIAESEELRTNKLVREVEIQEKACHEELAKAQPLVISAIAALNTLNKQNLTELKSMASPPPDVAMVTGAVMVLLADPQKIPKDRSWSAAKRMMANVTQWLKDMESFDRDNIPQVWGSLLCAMWPSIPALLQGPS